MLRSALALALGVGAFPAVASDWYFGVGGGGAWLLPDTVQSLDVDERTTPSARLSFGRHIDERTSLQLDLSSLGQARFVDSSAQVDYYGADASVLYRLVGNTDARGFDLFGRFAVGWRERQTDIELNDDSAMFFGIGIGAEYGLSDALSLRLDGLYEGEDAISSQLSLIVNLGASQGRRGGLPPLPPLPLSAESDMSVPANNEFSSERRVANAVNGDDNRYLSARVAAAPAAVVPGTPLAPLGGFGAIGPDGSVIYRAADAPPQPMQLADATAAINPSDVPDQASIGNALADAASVVGGRSQSVADSDGDGVADNRDRCASSAAGYPVRADGCPLLDGVLSGVRFRNASEQLEADAYSHLIALADLLKQYPDVKVELHSHSDSSGSVREQAILTRARLRSVGSYLMQQGVSANRLKLRSFGGAQPLYDNGDTEGQRLNNRIEIFEYRG